MDVRKTVVNSFVISRVDYFNRLLARVPRYQLNRLQSVLNTAARLIVGTKKHDHIKHLWDSLHCPPAPHPIFYFENATDTSAPVPKCLDTSALLHQCRSVLVPKCPDTSWSVL